MKSFKIAIAFLLILFPFALAEEVNLREAIRLYTLVSKAIESSSFTFTLIDMSFAVIPSILGIGALGLGGKMMIYGIERGISGARESFGFVASLGLSAISGGIGQVAIATRAAGAAGLTTSQKIAEFAKGAAIGVADALTRNPLVPLYISQNPYAFAKGSPVKNPEPKLKVVKPPETKPQEPGEPVGKIGQHTVYKVKDEKTGETIFQTGSKLEIPKEAWGSIEPLHKERLKL